MASRDDCFDYIDGLEFENEQLKRGIWKITLTDTCGEFLIRVHPDDTIEDVEVIVEGLLGRMRRSLPDKIQKYDIDSL